MKNVVIVGGSFAGVSTAHRILKQAANTSTGSFKVILVSRDSHFYWNIASPRGVLPGQISDEELFQPIAAGFARYPADQFEFILASATGIDVDGKKLEISGPDGQSRHIEYDYLILGTGSRTKADTPFKSRGSTEATREALHAYQKQIKQAKKIVVVGAGPTGVETAGELAFEYGRGKEIVLISSEKTVLQGTPASVSKTAEKQLGTLNVKVRLSTKVQNTAQMADGSQELTLSSGEKLVADMVIPTFGVIPNSSFVPAQFLNANGFVKVDEYLRVKGAENVFAIGDVSDAEPPQFIYVDKQSAHTAKNIVLVLRGMALLPYKVATSGMMGLQIGKKAGTGHFGNFKLPSFLVSTLRKSLFIERLAKTVDGSWF
ncbi:hypothetical protein F5Y19DRAFT_274788 [Xylariaceae sp. FL1651]|nr:hypothetical protein F5Y19DRAFT_274788 [Xylariaceae sp. FL1651]